MNGSLRRAARAALKPNAIIMGVATCLFGWSVAESLRPYDEYDVHLRPGWDLLVFLSASLVAASVGLAAKSACGNLLAAGLSGPLPLLHVFIFFAIPFDSEVTFLSAGHVERWLNELSDIPASVWLLTALSVAILFSATAVTLRRTPLRS
ncbi:MAG TPA: hypothetical protein VIP46_10795 [Pyrinomonadaceae bacterium]